MRKAALASLIVLAVLFSVVAPSHAWSRGHGHVVVAVGVGPVWWGPPWWWYPPPSYVYGPPPVVVQEPAVYVQAPPAPQAYWYYCPSAQAYYPNVQTCSDMWIKVPPRSE